MTKIPLGKVGLIMKKENYNSGTTYARNDIAYDGVDSSYVSLVDNNKGNPLTDTTKWKIIVSGKGATQAAQTAQAAATNANEKAALCVSATSGANTAATTANTAAQGANAAKEAAETAAEDCQEKTAEAQAVINQAAALEALNLVPTGLSVTYPQKVTVSNKQPVFIKAVLSPSIVLQNVIFLSDNKAVEVEPDGQITVVGVGRSRVHVIPTCKTAIAKTIQIEVVKPTVRLVTKTAIRLTQSGVFRLT